MRIGEEDPTGRETVDVRREGLRMAVKAADPVVEVVDSDHQDVRRILRRGERGEKECGEETWKDEAHER